jgi:hypothetical protein
MVPHATAVLEAASLLKKGSGSATCPRLRTPPLHLGGLQCYHMPRGSRPPVAIQEGSGAATRPSAPDPASSLWRDPALTRVLQLQTVPTSVVGSSADMCPKGLHGPWAVEESLAAIVCSEAHVFPRRACSLLRLLLDVWADDIIMTYKPCGQALQHRATMHRRADNRS